MIQRVQSKSIRRGIDGHEDVRRHSSWTKTLYRYRRCTRKLSITLRRIDNAIKLGPDRSCRDHFLERVIVHRGEVIATCALLPYTSLAELADAEVGQIAAEELDAGEVR